MDVVIVSKFEFCMFEWLAERDLLTDTHCRIECVIEEVTGGDDSLRYGTERVVDTFTFADPQNATAFRLTFANLTLN